MHFDNGSLIVGHWKGVPVRVHWTFALCALVFSRFRFEPVYWICFFLVVFLHEAGHVVVIRRLGLQVDEIAVHGMGGYCRWRGDASVLSRVLIAWGGVLAQLVLLIITYTLFRLVHLPHNAVTAQIFHAFVISNVLMIFFNLLPFEPLDGAKAWKLLAWMRDDVRTYLRQRRHRKQNEVLKRQLQVIMDQQDVEEK